MSIVHCKLPRAGLGNQLFPLMKACVFSHMNRLPLVVTDYKRLKIGHYLRMEKSKRNYNHSFYFQRNIFGDLTDRMSIALKTRSYEIIEEPELAEISGLAESGAIYRYSAIPHWKDYFKGLKEHRELVIDLFYRQLLPGVKQKLKNIEPPQIGVHIRMGDFRKLMPGDVFSKVGAVRTPEEYFVGVIQKLRAIYGANTPVSVFSDGYRHEFEEVTKLPGIHFIEANSDIVDMLLLSKSKIIVTSAGSTFGYWAGFLSDAPVIMHPYHIHEPIRSANTATRLYEGPLDDAGMLFLQKHELLKI